MSQSQFSSNNKKLQLFSISLHDLPVPDWLNDEVKLAFEALAPFIKNEVQVLYIRDIPFLNIDGKYPLGHCYNQYEAMISVPTWGTDKSQVVASINHELHHMARWQNSGYGKTLGGALVSEGIATYYEMKASGWIPPWSKITVSGEAKVAAIKEWDNKNYDHKTWFFDGLFGKWVGYSIGYQLAEKIFSDGFNLAKSITIEASEVRELLEQL